MRLRDNVDIEVRCPRTVCFAFLTLFQFAMRFSSRRTGGTVMFAVAATVVCVVVDLPRVTGLPPRVYLARGLTGRIDCPVDANPPVTIIIWAKNGVMVNNDDDGPGLIGSGGGGHGRRLRTSRQGTLFIRSVEKTDEGRYVCTPYSPLGKGQASMPVQVFVRGQSKYVLPPLFLYLSLCRFTFALFTYIACRFSVSDK